MFPSFLLLRLIDFDKSGSSVLSSDYLRVKTKVVALISIQETHSSTLQQNLRMRKVHVLSFNATEYAAALKYISIGTQYSLLVIT
jgi:hypothetical protein